jgi:hypothetical protein
MAARRAEGDRVAKYVGETLLACEAYDFTTTFAVVVSGDGPNVCGHLLLNTGGIGGSYFHIAERKGYPRRMSEDGYRRYLAENGKKELKRFKVAVANPDGANTMLNQLTANIWSWWVLPHNCASFVEEVVEAGGSAAGLYSNCPALESFD